MLVIGLIKDLSNLVSDDHGLGNRVSAARHCLGNHDAIYLTLLVALKYEVVQLEVSEVGLVSVGGQPLTVNDRESA